MAKELNSFMELQSEVQNKRVLVFGGFSGMGYADLEKLKETAYQRIKNEINDVGFDNLVIVSGATSDGIGVVYEMAKRLGITTYGIVSEAAKNYKLSDFCDKVFFVPDENNTWKVLSPSGDSYMVEVARKNGILIYYGGGDVSVSEIKEARQNGVDTEVFIEFEPNTEQLTKKLKTNPNIDPTPLRTFLLNKDSNN